MLGYYVDVWYLGLELQNLLNGRRCLFDGIVIDVGNGALILWLRRWVDLSSGLWLGLRLGLRLGLGSSRVSLCPSVAGTSLDGSWHRLFVLLLGRGCVGLSVIRSPVHPMTWITEK
jgi:hypothetical protein